MVSISNIPDRLCDVCTQARAKYLCPQCNLPYCSLDCFKTHGTDCTNQFYQNRVTEELKGQKASEAEKRSMQESLCRIHRSMKEPEEEIGGDPTEEEEPEDVLLRLSEKELSSLSLEDLNSEQRNNFLQLVKEGKMGAHIELWVPWWTSQTPSVEVAVPQARPLSELTTTPSSPLVVFAVAELMLSYCYVLRLYNGDAECDVIASVSLIQDLTPSLAAAPLASTELVLDQFVGRVCGLESSRSAGLVRHCLAVAQDAALVLNHQPHLSRALWHLNTLIKRAAKKAKRANNSSRTTSLLRASRKLEYFSSWAVAEEGRTATRRAKELREQANTYKGNTTK